MNIVLFGPPGAGKGTQSALLVGRNFLRHISTGDLLREAVRNQTALGMKAKSFIDAGNLVPDDVVIGLVKEVLEENKEQSVVLDGFPRTVAQAEALDQLFEQMGKKIGRALFLEVPRDALMARLTGRRVCGSCGAVFHVDTKPTQVDGVCDVCGGQVVQRKDDDASVIGTRLQAYDNSTTPVKAYYGSKGILVEVDGVGATEEVYGRLQAQLT